MDGWCGFDFGFDFGMFAGFSFVCSAFLGRWFVSGGFHGSGE